MVILSVAKDLKQTDSSALPQNDDLCRCHSRESGDLDSGFRIKCGMTRRVRNDEKSSLIIGIRNYFAFVF